MKSAVVSVYPDAFVAYDYETQLFTVYADRASYAALSAGKRSESSAWEDAARRVGVLKSVQTTV